MLRRRFKNITTQQPRRWPGLTLALLLSCGWLLAGDRPAAMEIRIGMGETELSRYVEYGYTAAVLGDLTQLAGYETAAPGAIPKGSELREKIEQHRRKFQRECEQAKKLGLAVCLSTDEIQLPVPVMDRFKKSIMRPDKPDRIDFESPAFWELYRAKYREVLRNFPDVKYVIVRTGENYSHPEQGYTGHTVMYKTMDDAYFAAMQRMIEETRKVVVDEFGRVLIWRTWDLGNDGFHANPKVYDRILAGVPDRRGLLLSVKFTQTDFWRYNDFNPMIGRGGIPQIIEFQCAREYEGKGAFPDYMGQEHAATMLKAHELGAKGVWIWDFGGGWGGPFLKSDRWVRLNIEATTRLAQDPTLSPRALAEEWASKEFGAAAAPKMADLLMLSSECVRKMAYIAPYSRTHKGWTPSRNLMRDDIIRGEKTLHDYTGLKNLYEGSKPSVAEALQEKKEAVALAGQMRSIFEDSRGSIVADRGEKVYDESLTSLIYLESLSKVVCHYVSGIFLYYQWQETGDNTTAENAQRELLAWRQAWSDYQAKVPALPGAPTIYRSQMDQDPGSGAGAMADLCESALQSIEARRAVYQSPQKNAPQALAPVSGASLK